jgi:hypothetical protein
VKKATEFMSSIYGLSDPVMLQLIKNPEYACAVMKSDFPIPERSFAALLEFCQTESWYDLFKLVARPLTQSQHHLVLTSRLRSDVLEKFLGYNNVDPSEIKNLTVGTAFLEKNVATMLHARYCSDPSVLYALLPLCKGVAAIEFAAAAASELCSDDIIAYATRMNDLCTHEVTDSGRCGGCGDNPADVDTPANYLRDLLERRPDALGTLLTEIGGPHVRTAIAGSRYVGHERYQDDLTARLGSCDVSVAELEKLVLNPSVPPRVRPALLRLAHQVGLPVLKRRCGHCPAGSSHTVTDCLPYVETSNYAEIADGGVLTYLCTRALRPNVRPRDWRPGTPFDLLEIARNPLLSSRVAHEVAFVLSLITTRVRVGDHQAKEAISYLQERFGESWLRDPALAPITCTPLLATYGGLGYIPAAREWCALGTKELAGTGPHAVSVARFTTDTKAKNAKPLMKALGADPKTWVCFVDMLDSVPRSTTVGTLVAAVRTLIATAPHHKVTSGASR